MGELMQYKDSAVLDKKGTGWIFQKTVYDASRFVGIATFIFGISLSGYWISRTTRTVRRVVLRKGGKYVTIVTYGILGFSSRYTTKAVSQCSAVRRTYQADKELFVHVKDHNFRYRFNLEDGIFSNRPLFERTIGQSRILR